MDKELKTLLKDAATKLKKESAPLIKSKQIPKSHVVRAYGNIVNQGDDLFADLLYRYLSGEFEIDEAVKKLNSREGTLIKAGKFFQLLEGHHPIYQKLLANRLFGTNADKALDVVDIVRKSVPENIGPGTDPTKLIQSTKNLHLLLGHGGNFRSNTAGILSDELSAPQMALALNPDLNEAAYRAGYLDTHPAQRRLINSIEEALGATNVEQLPIAARRNLLKASKDMGIRPELLYGVSEATSRAVPPNVNNLAKFGITNPAQANLLGRARGPMNAGFVTPELSIRTAGLGIGALGGLLDYKEGRSKGLSRPQSVARAGAGWAGAQYGALAAQALPIPHPMTRAAVTLAAAGLGSYGGKAAIDSAANTISPNKRNAAIKVQQSLIPTPKPVMANTPTGVAQLKAMPKSKTLIEAIDNELQWLGKAGQRAFSNIFGKREI